MLQGYKDVAMIVCCEKFWNAGMALQGVGRRLNEMQGGLMKRGEAGQVVDC